MLEVGSGAQRPCSASASCPRLGMYSFESVSCIGLIAYLFTQRGT